MRILKKDIKTNSNFLKVVWYKNTYSLKGSNPSLWFYWNAHIAVIGLFGSNSLEGGYNLHNYFVNWQNPTDEEICMFDLQFGEGMYDKITGLSLYDYD